MCVPHIQMIYLRSVVSIAHVLLLSGVVTPLSPDFFQVGRVLGVPNVLPGCLGHQRGGALQALHHPGQGGEQ